MISRRGGSASPGHTRCMSVRRVRVALVAASARGARRAPLQPHRRGQAVLRRPGRRSRALGQGRSRRRRGKARPGHVGARRRALLADRHGAPRDRRGASRGGPHRAAVPLHVDAPPCDPGPRCTSGTTRRGRCWPGCTRTPSWPRGSGGPTTTAACFRSVWIERFEADLDVVVEGYVAQGRALLPRRRGRDPRHPLVDDLDGSVARGRARRPRHVARPACRPRPALAARLGGPVHRRPGRRRRDPAPRRARHRPAPPARLAGVRRRPPGAVCSTRRPRRRGQLGRDHRWSAGPRRAAYLAGL